MKSSVPGENKRAKYGAVKTMVGNIVFDSKKEAARYAVLVQRMKAGDIRRLRCQPSYGLCALVIDYADPRDINAGSNSLRRAVVCEYVADFEYEESEDDPTGLRRDAKRWRLVIEDVKGMRTDIYKLKRRWFQAQYGIQILET